MTNNIFITPFLSPGGVKTERELAVFKSNSARTLLSCLAGWPFFPKNAPAIIIKNIYSAGCFQLLDNPTETPIKRQYGKGKRT